LISPVLFAPGWRFAKAIYRAIRQPRDRSHIAAEIPQSGSNSPPNADARLAVQVVASGLSSAARRHPAVFSRCVSTSLNT
jgi:hypothetical protein